jgi:hypothetical protein
LKTAEAETARERPNWGRVDEEPGTAPADCSGAKAHEPLAQFHVELRSEIVQQTAWAMEEFSTRNGRHCQRFGYRFNVRGGTHDVPMPR